MLPSVLKNRPQGLLSQHSEGQSELRAAGVALQRLSNTLAATPPETRAEAVNTMLSDGIVALSDTLKHTMASATELETLNNARELTAREYTSWSAEADPDPDTNLELVFNEYHRQEQQKYTDENKYTPNQHRVFSDFWNAVRRAADPHATPLSAQELEDYENGLIVVRSHESFLCPIAMTFLERPVRAPCNHYFSQAAFDEWAARYQHRKDVVCPVSGCPATWDPHEVVFDEQMEKKVEVERTRLRAERQKRTQSAVRV